MSNNILATIISFFLPGIGEMIEGQTYKGGVMFLIAIILWICAYMVTNYFIGVSFIYSLYAAYDTYKI